MFLLEMDGKDCETKQKKLKKRHIYITRLKSECNSMKFLKPPAVKCN